MNFIDPAGLDTYYIDNKIGSSTPTNSPLSHSFVATTDRDPISGAEVVTDTFSWGNNGSSQWYYNDPRNVNGAQNAIDAGVGATWNGGEDMDSIVYGEFLERQNDTTRYNPVFNNCKDNACSLLRDALEQQGGVCR